MSTSNVIDALAASSIQNNLSSDQLTASGISTNYTPPTGVSYTDNLNNILNYTTIKRACCVNKGRLGSTTTTYPVTVRIPTPTGYVYDNNDPRTTVWQKYGYIDKTINIPDALCSTYAPNYQYGTDKCDNFMGLYCKNIWNFYTDEVSQAGSVISDDEFAQYKPECACYMPQPSYITGAVAPACWAPGCDPNNNQCYQDANSRQKCSVTICTSNFNASSINAGGATTINSKVTQECGNQVNQSPTSGTTGNTSNTSNNTSNNNTSTNNTSNNNTSTNNTSNNTSNTSTNNTSGGTSGGSSGSSGTSGGSNTPPTSSSNNTMTYFAYGCGILIILILLFCCYKSLSGSKKKHK
jgi:hypothetical protein